MMSTGCSMNTTVTLDSCWTSMRQSGSSLADQGDALWFDGDCSLAKKKMRRLEHAFRWTRLPDCQASWQKAIAEYRALLRVKEQCYWSSRISDSTHNPRKLWNSLKPLLQPAATQAQITADVFASFFRDKVKSIRDDTALTPDTIPITIRQQSAPSTCKWMIT